MMCTSPIYIRSPAGTINQVPCSKCAACKKTRREEWTIRLTEEWKESESAIFITLTYSESYVHKNSKGVDSVNKKDVQDFIKRLRTKTEKKVRYYAISEYGTRTLRPHYHIIIFNLSIDDVNIIDKSWNNDGISRGHITVTNLNIRRLRYTCKYHINKNIIRKDAEKNFCLMSTKPAIGYKYVEKNKNFHISIKNSYYQHYNCKMKLPRYYKNKLYTEEQRKQIAEKFQDIQSEITIEEIEELKRKNTNYFVEKLQRIEEFNRKFREKANYNDKI